MGLIAEPTADGHLNQREIAGEHERACPIQASLNDIGVRRLIEALPEGAREMRHAEANQIAEIRMRIGRINALRRMPSAGEFSTVRVA